MSPASAKAARPAARFCSTGNRGRHLSEIQFEEWILRPCCAPICRRAGQDARRSSVYPFPASGAVAGWQKTGETRTFAAKDLWQYIDGDAEQYIAAGVVSTSTSDYKYEGQLEALWMFTP